MTLSLVTVSGFLEAEGAWDKEKVSWANLVWPKLPAQVIRAEFAPATGGGNSSPGKDQARWKSWARGPCCAPVSGHMWGHSGRVTLPTLNCLRKDPENKPTVKMASVATQAPLSFKAARTLTGRQF